MLTKKLLQAPMIVDFKLCELINACQKRYRLSVTELAEKLGISARTIYRAKKGLRVNRKLRADILVLYCALAYEEKENPDLVK